MIIKINAVELFMARKNYNTLRNCLSLIVRNFSTNQKKTKHFFEIEKKSQKVELKYNFLDALESTYFKN